MEKGATQLKVTGALMFFSKTKTRNSRARDSPLIVVAGKDLKVNYDAYVVVVALDSAGKAIGKPSATSKVT
jgi:hypothetical protein